MKISCATVVCQCVQGVVKQILPLTDGNGDDTVTGLDVCSSFLLVITVFNSLYIYDLSRGSAS